MVLEKRSLEQRNKLLIDKRFEEINELEQSNKLLIDKRFEEINELVLKRWIQEKNNEKIKSVKMSTLRLTFLKIIIQKLLFTSFL